MYRKTKKIIGLLLAVFVVAVTFSAPVQNLSSIPMNLKMFEGQMTAFDVASLFDTVVDGDEEVVAVSGGELTTIKSGRTDITFKLFGVLPIKKVQVQVLPETKLYPGGHSIGVKLKSEGVMVVGFYLVDVEDNKVSPGELANIKVGDYIVKVNGNRVEDVASITNLIDSSEGIEMEIKRNDRTFTTVVYPQYDTKSKNHRIGLYIRDSAAGVGTLTFFDPRTSMYGALGHVITDIDTGQPIEVGSGDIFPSRVTSIDKGEKGKPGEKKCVIANEQQKLGSIVSNNSLGIYGKLTDVPEKYFENEPMPIALAHDVKVGPAKIYTVVEDEKIETFDIEIVNVIPQRFSSTKGMVIRVTDERLLSKTGGIIQGMSGSPIIQEGKIIGAVTHVFVNDPTMGYGCYIEWMLKEANDNAVNSNAA